MKKRSALLTTSLLGICLAIPTLIWAHGDVTPQVVNTEGLDPLGDEWLETNPYIKDGEFNATAVEIGSSAYNQNCARCHGLEGISGGIAPDLRELEEGLEGDEWYVYRVREGAVRDGKVYMPAFEAFLSQEALWAIRTWLVSISEN